MSKRSNPISVRLPAKSRAALDKAAKAAKCTRSEIINLALERHLDHIAREKAVESKEVRLKRLMDFAGIGAPYSTYKTAEEVIEEIRRERDYERGV